MISKIAKVTTKDDELVEVEILDFIAVHNVVKAVCKFPDGSLEAVILSNVRIL